MLVGLFWVLFYISASKEFIVTSNIYVNVINALNFTGFKKIAYRNMNVKT